MVSSPTHRDHGLTTDTYYTITARDARGNVTQVVKRGVTVERSFDAATGRPLGIQAENIGFETLQDLTLTFDELGNLKTKHDASATEGGGFKNLTEAYEYDDLNRLTQVDQNGNTTLTLAYDALGNLTSKLAYTTVGTTDTNATVGAYGYGSRPHAVTSAGSATYSYDANGSMVSGDGRTIGYAVMGKPVSIVRGSATATLYYGPDRARYKRIDNLNQASETETHYLGSVERIFKPGGIEVIRRDLDGEALVVRTLNGTVTTETLTLLKDPLGSTHLVVDDAGDVVQGMSFDAFGRRRSDASFGSFSNAQVWNFDTSRTTRGYTGHEGLDPVGLVHMNGRVYDPKLGRFLSADPFVQAPANTQSHNRTATSGTIR